VAIFLLATARTCAVRLLDSHAHTAHRSLLHQVGHAQTALGSYHGCTPSPTCPRAHSHTLHPCVVTAHHLLHTRPPDILAGLAYLRSMAITYFSLGLLCSIPGSRTSYHSDQELRAFVTTRVTKTSPATSGDSQVRTIGMFGRPSWVASGAGDADCGAIGCSVLFFSSLASAEYLGLLTRRRGWGPSGGDCINAPPRAVCVGLTQEQTHPAVVPGPP
jgi:hypothetical protein